MSTDEIESSKHNADRVHLHFNQFLMVRLHFEAEVKQLQQNNHQLFTGHQIPNSSHPTIHTVNAHHYTLMIKVKVWVLAIALLTRLERSALQSRKWQLIGMS